MTPILEAIERAILAYVKQDEIDGDGTLAIILDGELQICVGEEDGRKILIDSHRLALAKMIEESITEALHK